MDITVVLPIIINILVCILLIVLIVLGIKCIIVLDKADKICDNVENKLNTLNGFFNTIGRIDKGIDKAISFVFDGVSNLIDKVIK